MVDERDAEQASMDDTVVVLHLPYVFECPICGKEQQHVFLCLLCGGVFPAECGEDHATTIEDAPSFFQERYYSDGIGLGNLTIKRWVGLPSVPHDDVVKIGFLDSHSRPQHGRIIRNRSVGRPTGQRSGE